MFDEHFPNCCSIHVSSLLAILIFVYFFLINFDIKDKIEHFSNLKINVYFLFSALNNHNDRGNVLRTKEYRLFHATHQNGLGSAFHSTVDGRIAFDTNGNSTLKLK